MVERSWEIDLGLSHYKVTINEGLGSRTRSEAEVRILQWLVFDLRRSLQDFDPEVTEIAQRMRHALRGHGPFKPRPREGNVAYRQYVTTLVNEIKWACESGKLLVEDLRAEELILTPIEEVEEKAYVPQAPVVEKETFIGVRIKDQDGDPVVNSRVRVELPDGGVKEGFTNSQGELKIAGFVLDGPAKITLLDHAEPGNADPPEWPEEKTFKVHVVDEVNQDLSGVWLSFRHGSASNLAQTDDSGVAKYTTSDADSVSVSFESADTLASVMKPIWTDSRQVERKDWVQADDSTTTVSIFGGNVVKAIADSSTTGTTRPSETLEPFFGVQTTVDKPATLSVQPLVIMVRMLGEHFDTDKCFLLPKALNSVRDLVKLHKEYALTDLLIVGHTDTTASDEHNLVLSLERTSAMRAYLTNNAEAWLPWYESSKQQSKRWGTTEDNYIIGTLLEGTDYDPTVHGYQQWHNAAAPKTQDSEDLEEDGAIGPLTRKQMIVDYMHRDGTSVPEGTAIQVHGCGEFFPLDKSEEHVDTDAPDNDEEQRNRRVEVFLFPREVGVLPPVPGERASKGELEYPEWRRRSVEVVVRSSGEAQQYALHALDEDGNALMPAEYYVKVGYTEYDGTTNDGWIRFPVPQDICVTCRVRWGRPDDDPKLPNMLDVAFNCDVNAQDEETEVRNKLHNLGYSNHFPLDECLGYFQDDEKLTERGRDANGNIPASTMQRLREIYSEHSNG